MTTDVREADRISRLEEELRSLKATVDSDRRENAISIVCFSGDWDRLFATFTIANGALAIGMEVDIFFTFWGATAVRNGKEARGGQQNVFQQAFSRLLPKSAGGAPLSRFHFFGLGKKVLRGLMKKKGVDDLPKLIEEAEALGARMHYCETSVGLFGWGADDLRQPSSSDWCGVTTFLSLARKSRCVLFI